MKAAVQPYIVVIDDDPTSDALLARICRAKVCAFRSAESAVANTTKLKPKAVFVDVFLEGPLLGTEIIKELKERWPYVPLLAMSSSQKPDILELALNSGADDFLSKPLNPAIVSARFNRRLLDLSGRSKFDVVEHEGLSLNFITGFLKFEDASTLLDPRTRILARCLIAVSGEDVEAQTLLSAAWGSVKVSKNALERKISLLRAELRRINCPHRIATSYGRGYFLDTSRNDKETAPAASSMLPRLIFVDDSEPSRAVGDAIFTKLGFDVETFASAEDALAALEIRPAHLVIIDENLPRLSGSEAASIISKRWPEISIFGVHASPSLGLTERCLRAGMLGVASKPLSLQSARQLVECSERKTPIVDDPTSGEQRVANEKLQKMWPSLDHGVLTELAGFGFDFANETISIGLKACDEAIRQLQEELPREASTSDLWRERWKRSAHKIKGLCLGIGIGAGEAVLWEQIEDGAETRSFESLKTLIDAAVASYARFRG